MLRKRVLSSLLALCCILGLSGAAFAVEVDSDTVYCFSQEDFAGEEPLAGICITQLPDASAGTVMLGSRVLRPGDILTADQLAQMTFAPLQSRTDKTASVSYLPIYSNRVEPSATMTLSIRGKEDKAPVAEDCAIETYKNLPNESKLKVTDPEGQPMTYTVTRQPKRGEVEIREDGTFIYTPKKNKVGVDSFTFTATDPAGNVSREATVTIQILKPTDATQYTDTVGNPCRFAAEWMRNTGLFVGERVGDAECFYPERNVSRGEFLTMVVKSLNIPAEKMDDVAADAPDWLKPYLAAAVRAGLTAGLPTDESGSFRTDAPITGGEAAVILQNALDLSVPAEETAAEIDGDGNQISAWAADSLAAMAGSGIELSAEETLTRGQVAQLLYQVNGLMEDAPGTAVFRLQK